jgi:hypothetical protein
MQANVDHSSNPTSALVALAALILKRAKLGSLPCTNREQAIRIIRGVRPAPPRTSKQHFKPYVALCCVCHGPLETGTLCDSLGRTHIACQGDNRETT